MRFPSENLYLSETLPEGQGFAMERVDLHADGHAWLALTRKPAASLELFEVMIEDVATVLQQLRQNPELLLKTVLRRIKAWQEFMRSGSVVLTPDQEVGLYGELTVLLGMLSSGMDPVGVLEGWVGPLDGVQDFEVGAGAIEVKTTLATNGFPARVGSLEQLAYSGADGHAVR